VAISSPVVVVAWLTRRLLPQQIACAAIVNTCVLLSLAGVLIGFSIAGVKQTWDLLCKRSLKDLATTRRGIAASSVVANHFPVTN